MAPENVEVGVGGVMAADLMKKLATAVFVTFALLLGATAWAGDARGPVVVELFTSQGCSSCVPADRLLGELAALDDIVALSFHVDYWDYIGWTDPFASAETTARQHAYARALGQRNVYTPEIVIGGVTHRVGSDTDAVRAAIREVRETAGAGAKVTIEMNGPDVLRVTVGASHYSGAADVLLVRYDARHETPVSRGENAGRTVINHNVVREFRKIGSWSGQETSFDIRWSEITDRGSDSCAVIVQASGTGAVLGAARFDMMAAR